MEPKEGFSSKPSLIAFWAKDVAAQIQPLDAKVHLTGMTLAGDQKHGAYPLGICSMAIENWNLQLIYPLKMVI